MIRNYNIVFVSKILVNVSISIRLKEIKEGSWTLIVYDRVHKVESSLMN
jgi:hypothetical protein